MRTKNKKVLGLSLKHKTDKKELSKPKPVPIKNLEAILYESKPKNPHVWTYIEFPSPQISMKFFEILFLGLILSMKKYFSDLDQLQF